VLFNSYEFIFAFLPATFCAYYLLGRFRPLWGKAVLAGASLVFYASSAVANLPLMLLSIATNWLVSRFILDERRPGRVRDLALWCGVCGNLATLFLYKYADFAAGLLAGNLASHTAVGVIPLGISFFTFTQLAFLVDARRGLASQHSPLDYLLFVTVFPHLIAGPIIHHQEMMPQFSNPATYRMDGRKLAQGVTLFAIGLGKKVLLADTVGDYVGPVFNAAAPTFVEAWCGALAYAFQIYFDFSGYSDMAVGLGLMFGLRLPVNFDSPYRAASIIDFWRRWHLSLSRFLRDYLYIPLGGNRLGRGRRYANLLATMVLGGLWHGANLTFLAWGAIHGAALALNHAWRELRPQGGPCLGGRLSGQALTFLVVVVAWVFFRAADMGEAVRVLAGMAGLNGIVVPESYAALPGLRQLTQALGLPAYYLPTFLGAKELACLLLLAVIAWVLPNSQDIVLQENRAAWLALRPTRKWAMAISLLLAASIMGVSKDAQFLYFQF
jgi:D-alanyl-lipoteichoic acid acyltransferase DltB (MBOAT superfamily)